MKIVGIDIGGTFTDLVAVDESGALRIEKVPSTPPDFEQGIRRAFQDAKLRGEEVSVILHGTTVATNTVITKTGAKTGLITTEGFRDLLELRRGNRGVLYDLMWDPPPPLVRRRDRLTVKERVDYAGQVVTPLDEAEARHKIEVLQKRGVESLAVCFLNGFVNPEHERTVKEIIKELFPDVYVSVASDVLPQPPEFERTSTVVANAYIGPSSSRYISRVSATLREVGYDGNILIMHSGGGLVTTESATEVPVRLAQSGPAAGVIAAAAIGKATGRKDLISLDMGGTSADIAVIFGGEPRITPEFDIEWGVPVLFPTIDMVTIGAGGGSIAWLDAAGYPKSGPQSAGAIPGPVAYGQGGTEPTNTDANIALGRLNPDTFLGGKMSIDVVLAREAIREKISEPLGLDVEQAAAGILRISNNNMSAALRLVTIQRGYDPREMSLISFGGAGGLHCAELAREMEIPEVIVPPLPGIVSALGLLFADLRHDLVQAYIAETTDVDFAATSAMFESMETEARRRLEQETEPGSAIEISRAIDFRYAGQVRTITIGLDEGDSFDAVLLGRTVEHFHEEHEREFGYARREFPVETAALRVAGRGETIKVALEALARAIAVEEGDPVKGTRDVYFAEHGYVATTIYERGRLASGFEFRGPAILEEMDSTVLVPPGCNATVDDLRNAILRFDG
jgi:N-methylhydantoinase A